MVRWLSCERRLQAKSDSAISRSISAQKRNPSRALPVWCRCTFSSTRHASCWLNVPSLAHCTTGVCWSLSRATVLAPWLPSVYLAYVASPNLIVFFSCSPKLLRLVIALLDLQRGPSVTTCPPSPVRWLVHQLHRRQLSPCSSTRHCTSITVRAVPHTLDTGHCTLGHAGPRN